MFTLEVELEAELSLNLQIGLERSVHEEIYLYIVRGAVSFASRAESIPTHIKASICDQVTGMHTGSVSLPNGLTDRNSL